MSIEEVTRYLTMGKEFDSLEKAKQFRYDRVGEFMDKAPVLLGPGDRIKIADYITKNRKELCKLLEY
jgi:hypothetical protein